MPDLYAYPTGLNTHAVADVAGYFRGTVPLEHAVHAAWELAGYGLSVWVPDAGHVTLAAELPQGEEAAKAVEALLPATAARTEISWPTILALVLKILEAWLHR